MSNDEPSNYNGLILFIKKGSFAKLSKIVTNP